MPELERMLKNTLFALERGVTSTQETHGKGLDDQQKRLEVQTRHIQQLQENITQLRAEQQEYVRHLQCLSDINANLEPLLSRLNALLHAK